jgi:vancomycin resistance protein YoaR
VRAETSTIRPAARRRRPQRLALRRGVFAAAALAVLAGLVGLAFAGSSATLAAGTQVAGIDVGGLTPREATAQLESRAKAVARSPVTFVAAGERFNVYPAQLGVEADWRRAVAVAAEEGDGFGPLRGYRRLHVRLFGEEVSPALAVSNAALEYKLDQIARAVDQPFVNASLRRRGLRVEMVPGSTGRRLDREAAAETIVRALGSLERGIPVALPVVGSPPKVTAELLAPVAVQARTALSAPIRLSYGEASWRVPRSRLAQLLELPANGATRLAVAGKGAEAYLGRLAANLDREPVDASFAVEPGGIDVVPAEPGRALDAAATARAIQTAMLSTTTWRAELVVREAPPERTTAEARAMGITGVVSSYTTTYGGTEGRLHNVQLVAELIDDTLIAPGTVFSFNATTGERNEAKGFEEAPVIINGELQNGIGGGVCQVSTTVFNAAFDAGLSIEERTNHALYISHYPLGRDATVNYPDLDLKFKNDTESWLLLRTFVGSGSLTVNLYGTPVGRRVETETAPLVETGPVPVEEIADPTLERGERVVDIWGQPPRETSVRRTVYAPDGTELYDTTWRSYYDAEPSIVRVGTKAPPKPKPKPKAKPEQTAPAGTTDGETATTPTETTPTPTETTAPTGDPTPVTAGTPR